MSSETFPPDVAGAVAELEEAFPGRVEVHPDPSGAVIEVHDIELGPGWSAATGSLWLLVPFHYPDAAIYPYYVTDADHAQAPGLRTVSWRGDPAMQVSLRHNVWDPVRDTAVGSVLQALRWLRAS